MLLLKGSELTSLESVSHINWKDYPDILARILRLRRQPMSQETGYIQEIDQTINILKVMGPVFSLLQKVGKYRRG